MFFFKYLLAQLVCIFYKEPYYIIYVQSLNTYLSFRLCFVAGREGHFLEPMSYIHVRRSTPGPAVALQGLVSFLFICVGDIEALIEFASFLIWVMYGAAFACLIVLRRTQPNTPRPYKVPIIIPIFTLAVAVFLSIMPIIDEPSLKYLAALAFMFSGVLIYIPFVYYRIRPKFMGMSLKLCMHDIKSNPVICIC